MKFGKAWIVLAAWGLFAVAGADAVGGTEPDAAATKPEAAATKPETPPPLHAAAEKNDVEAIKALLAKGTDVNNKNEEGCSALHFAAAKNCLDAAKLLIDKGADVNTKTKDGFTPLHGAADKNSTDVTKLLIDKGADVNAKDNDGRTPLHFAADKNSADVTKLLIDKGSDVNAKNKDGETPLHFAAFNNSADVSKLLLDKGSDVNAKNEVGFTPLHFAAFNNSVDVSKLLLERGAKQRKSKDGFNPLHLAAVNNSADVAELLLRHGAKVNVRDNDGTTPLMLAVDKNNIKVAQILANHGAKISYEALLHSTIPQAIRQRNYDMLKFITSINCDDTNGRTDAETVWLIVQSNDTNAAKIVFPSVAKRHGVPWNLMTRTMRSEMDTICVIAKALCFAASRGNVDMGRIIIENFPANPLHNCINEKVTKGINFTVPLIVACENQNFEYAKFLIEHGANIHWACDKDGDIEMNALYYAVKADDSEFVKYLLSKGAKAGKGLVKLTKNEDIIELLDGEE